MGYAVGAWITAQVAGFFVENDYLSHRFLDLTLYLLALGFAVAIVLVWFHGERGQQRVTRTEGLLLGGILLAGTAGAVWVTTRDVEPDLSGSQGALHDLGEGSVAVLPFHNRVTDPSLEWLDQGIADLLATDLAQIRTLRVVSGQRIFDLLRQEGVEGVRNVPEDLESRIAIQAGARFMLVGSVLGSTSALSINAQLVNLETGEIEASAREQGPDVFALVDQLSAAMSSQILATPIEPTELTPVAQLTTPNLEAFRHYQLGREARNQFELREAAGHFEAALELDPAFALAHFQLAGALFELGNVTDAVEHLQHARENLTTAAERDRLFIEGLSSFFEGEPARGEALFGELFVKYPDEKDARIAFVGFLSQLGREDEARRLLEETIALDPFYSPAFNQLAYYHARRGNHHLADSLIGRYVELEPGRPNPLDSQGEIHEMAGRPTEAREAYRAALRLDPTFVVSLSHLVRSHLREDDSEAARVELETHLSSTVPELRTEALLLYGDTELWDGELERGLARYGEADAYAEEEERPDLRIRVLRPLWDANVVLEQFDEAVEAGERLAVLDPLAGVVQTAQLMRHGARGEMEAAQVIRDGFERFRDDPRLAPFFEFIAAEFDLHLAFYRGDYETVVELARLWETVPGAPGDLDGYPVIRSLLNLGRGEEAAELAREVSAGRGFVEINRLDPLRYRHGQYFEGRAAELNGDSAAAVAAYQDLVDAWGDRLLEAPLLADTADRLSALSEPESDEPR